MQKSLIALVGDFAAFDKQLVESGGEITPEMEAALDLTGADMARKVDGYKLYMDHLDAQAMYFEDIEKQAQHGKRLFNNHREKMKENLKFAMTCLGVDELAGEAFRFKKSTLKPKLVIESQDALPPSYIKKEMVEVTSIDKESLMIDLGLGKSVAGAQLVDVVSVRSYVNPAAKARPVKELKAKKEKS